MPNPYTPRRSPRSGAGGRPPLISRESILAAARGLPVDKLTMPLVASKLGVNAAALYYHFESRGALLAELSSLIVTDFKVRPVDARRWRLWLEQTILDFYRFMVANPVVFEIESWSYTVRISGPASEIVLQGLEEAGFDTTESFQMVSVLGAFIYTQARAQYDASRVDEKTKRQMAEKYATYLQQLPRLHATIAKLSSQDPEQVVVKNLRWLISLLPGPRSTRRSAVKQRKA